MNIESRQRVIKVAPMNFKPHEENSIRNLLIPVQGEYNREFTYSLTSSGAARNAEILIAKMETSDYIRTSQLLKRVYGVRSTIFVSDASRPGNANGYRYVLRGNELDSNLVNMLDAVSQAELRSDTVNVKKAKPSSTGGQFKSGSETTRNNFHGRVLIVDDSQSVRTQLDEYLNKRNFECYTAQDSEEAIRAVQQVQFDMIFLDVIMPGVDGYQACKVIKSLAGTKQIPVILLTSKNSPIDRIHGIMSGCDRYLTKPVRSSELEDLLHSYFPDFIARKAQRV